MKNCLDDPKNINNKSNYYVFINIILIIYFMIISYYYSVNVVLKTFFKKYCG